MMATEIIEIDAPWAEKWTKTRVSFLSAPTVDNGVLCRICNTSPQNTQNMLIVDGYMIGARDK